MAFFDTPELAKERTPGITFLGDFLNGIDVIYEVSCVPLERRWGFEIIALYPNFDVIFEVN